MMIKTFLQEIDGINLVDIGSSGELDGKWNPLRKYINLVGFDPNEEECRRMSMLPGDFRSVRYIPCAIAGERGSASLFMTRSIYCYSLLKPNLQWLRRFSFHDLFEIEGETEVKTEVLDHIPEINSMNVDVLKTDTQGLELPVLRTSGKILDSAFLVETETGFVENYEGETTYSQVDEFMRFNDYLLFDINTSHRISRDNVFRNVNTGHEQLLWCEAVWLKDYVALANKGIINGTNMSRERILKALILCGLQGCIDYGYEIATLGRRMRLLTDSEVRSLESAASWKLVEDVPADRTSFSRVLNYLLRLLPSRHRKLIKEQAEIAMRQRHLFRG